jgi:hypothetical protein
MMTQQELKKFLTIHRRSPYGRHHTGHITETQEHGVHNEKPSERETAPCMGNSREWTLASTEHFELG